jgi:hypothetical protein
VIQRLDIQQGAPTQQQSKLSVEAAIFIDGSDLGDLLALTEVPYRWGWEAKEQWDEPSAPSQSRLNDEAFFNQQPVQSPTWVVMGQLSQSRPLFRQRSATVQGLNARTAFRIEHDLLWFGADDHLRTLTRWLSHAQLAIARQRLASRSAQGHQP